MVGFPETCRPKRDQGAIADDVLTVLAVDHRQVGTLIVFRAKPWHVLRGDAQPAKCHWTVVVQQKLEVLAPTDEAGFGETVLIGRALKGARHRRGAILRVA